MTKLGYKKMSVDFDENILFEIDQMEPRNAGYWINKCLEEYFRIKQMIAKEALQAFGSKMTEEEKKLWESL